MKTQVFALFLIGLLAASASHSHLRAHAHHHGATTTTTMSRSNSEMIEDQADFLDDMDHDAIIAPPTGNLAVMEKDYEY